MGERTTQAERQVAEQRGRITRMLDSIEERTRDDLAAVQQGVTGRATDLRDRAMNQIGRAPGIDAVTGQVSRRPLTSLMAGFGAGAALGVLGGAVMPERRGATGRSRQYRDRDSDSRPVEEREGMLGGVLGMLVGPAVGGLAGPVQSELRSLLREAVSGFLGESGEQRQDEAQPRNAEAMGATAVQADARAADEPRRAA